MAFAAGCGEKKQDDTSVGQELFQGGVLGEGKTQLEFIVVDKEGKETAFEIHTDKTIVGEALMELGLLEGEAGGVYGVNACHGFAFGILYAPAQALLYGLNFKEMLVWIAAGFQFDITHGINNFICGTLIVPIVYLLRRLENSVN